MPLTKQEIIDYASRYVTPQESVDFPFNGDLFCLLGRELPEGKVLSEEDGWSFQGYGVCLGYSLDEEAVPAGKWLWMHFASLVSFPPAAQVFKLQPPHVVKGRFQDPSRTREFRILKVSLGKVDDASEKNRVPDMPQESNPAGTDREEGPLKGKIVQFRRKSPDSVPPRPIRG